MTFKSRIKRCLKEEQVGAAAVEAVIMFPLIFASIMAMMYFLFFCMSYIAYSNNANIIAHRMNMGRNGYAIVINKYQTDISNGQVPYIPTTMLANSADGKMVNVGGVNGSLGFNDIKIYDTLGNSVESNNQLVRAALYNAFDSSGINRAGAGDDLKSHFVMPFTQIVGIDVHTSRPLSFAGKTGTQATSGIIVRVDIRFRTVNPLSAMNRLDEFGGGNYTNNAPAAAGRSYSTIFNVRAVGYDVIA